MTDIPENALRGRQMYLEGATTREIIAETRLSHWALYYWLAGGPKQENGERLLPEIPKRRMVLRRKILKEDRVALISRMMKTAERQVYEIETRLAGSKQEPGDRERDARTLAVLAKTLQSLTAIDALHENDAAKRKTSKNESIPRSIDELRISVAEKLEAIAAGQNSRGDEQA